MESKDVGWATFWNDAAGFSDSFQQQMAEQLMTQFNSTLKIKNAAKQRFFQLFVGMEEMNITCKDGYALATVEICCPDSSARPISAYWKTENTDRLLSCINDNSLTASTIQFGWCSDFEKEHFLSFFTPKNLLDKEKYNLVFDVEFTVDLYPDLGINLYSNDVLGKEDLKEIYETLTQTIPGAYVSELSFSEGSYAGIIDFQDTPYKKGIEEFITALQMISSGEQGQYIHFIRIE